MTKICIFYFSGTGNTWWVAHKLTDEFCHNDCNAKAYSIEAISPDDAKLLINEADIVGFGYPIYGSDLPQIMKDFIWKLEPVQEKKAFVFCTQWLWSGDGARLGASFLTPKGFKVDWGEHFLMPNNVCISMIPFLPYTNEYSRFESKLRRSGQKAAQFVGSMLKGTKALRGFNRGAQFLGAIQRVPFRKGFGKMRNSIGINNDRCFRCQLCVNNCPSGNITFERETFSTHGVCILCMRCYNFCPNSAITYSGKNHNLTRGKPYQGPTKEFHPKTLRRKLPIK